MYRIIKTIFIHKDGHREHSNEEKVVRNLETHRANIMKPEYERVNFVYQEIQEDDNRKDISDKGASTAEEPCNQSGI